MTLEQVELDVSIIEFGRLRDEMLDRLDHIRTISKEPGQNIAVDENMQLSILPEFEDRARQIWQEIKNMRFQNKNAAAYLDFALSVLTKYNIPISNDKDGIPHLANIENIRSQEGRKTQSLISHLTQDLESGKIKGADYDKQKASCEKVYHDKVNELMKSKDELQKFIDSLPAGA